MYSLLSTVFYVLASLIIGLVLIKAIIFVLKIDTNFQVNLFFSTGFLLGQGILANLWLLLGLYSCFKFLVIIGILSITIFIGFYYVKDYYLQFIRKVKETFYEIKGLSVTWKVLLFILLFSVFIYGLASIVYPVMGDAEAFYMVFPKIMAASEQLKPQPNYYEFSQIGLFGEMHYAVLMTIGSPQAAKFFVWFTGLVLAGLLLSFCAIASLETRGQIAALIILFTSSTFTNFLYDGKVDVFGGALGLAAYYWALQTGKKFGYLAYVLTGLFAGFSIIAKFSNIPVILSGIILIMIWNHWPQLKRGEKIHSLVLGPFILVGLTFIIAIIPHLIKNWVLFKEPFAPFFFFKSKGANWADQAWFSPKTTKFILMTYPVALVFGQYPMQGGNLSPLILAYMPLLILKKKAQWFLSKNLLQITIVAIFGLITWMIVRPAVISPRYILATLLLFIPIVAWCAEKITVTDFSPFLRKTVFISLFLALLIALLPVRPVPEKFAKWISNGCRESDCSNGNYKPLSFINEIASPGDRVFFGGYYTYYLRADLLQCMNEPNESEFYNLKTPAKRWNYLFDHGFKFLVIQKSSHGSLFDESKIYPIPSELVVKKIYDLKDTMIFSIAANSKTLQPRFGTRQQPYPAWEVYQIKKEEKNK